MKPAHEKVLSCGILIQSPAGWLLAHATRTPRWDIPKGKVEPGESAMEAALRETREEIGIDLSWARERMVDLGRHAYLPRKDLHLFHLVIDQPLDVSQCTCSTLIDLPSGEQLPETDDYAWMTPGQARNFIGRGLAAYLTARGLLDPEPAEHRVVDEENMMRPSNALLNGGHGILLATPKYPYR